MAHRSTFRCFVQSVRRRKLPALIETSFYFWYWRFAVSLLTGTVYAAPLPPPADPKSCLPVVAECTGDAVESPAHDCRFGRCHLARAAVSGSKGRTPGERKRRVMLFRRLFCCSGYSQSHHKCQAEMHSRKDDRQRRFTAVASLL